MPERTAATRRLRPFRPAPMHRWTLHREGAVRSV